MKPPILFIHGAFTRAERWRPWLSYFGSAGYDYLAPSLPGHDPPDPERLSSLTFDDYLVAAATAAKAFDRPPVVIGHSMGGLIAQHVAANSECAGLVLVSSTPPWRTGTTRHAAPYTLNYVIPVLTGRPIRANPRAALNLVLHDLSPEEQRDLIPIFAYESGKAYRTMVFGGAPMRAGAVRCPVLVLSGGADRLLNPAVGARLARFYNAEHLIFPGRGHSLVAGSLIGTVAASVSEWIGALDRPEQPGAPSFQTDAVV